MGADMAFELFSHVTRFLGRKVVLLGLYNGQRLEAEPAADLVSYSRVDEVGGAQGSGSEGEGPAVGAATGLRSGGAACVEACTPACRR